MSEDHTHDVNGKFPDVSRREDGGDFINLDESDTSDVNPSADDLGRRDPDSGVARQGDRNENVEVDSDPPRRSIVKAALAVVLGMVAMVTPVAAGVWMWLSPVLKKKRSPGGGSSDGEHSGGGHAGGGRFVEVGRFSTLPVDGTPVQRPVIAQRIDAWNTYPAMPIGAVYVRRTGEDSVQILSAVCPHASCFVGMQSDEVFRCPCHESEFDASGAIIETTSTGKTTVSPRGLDELEARIEGDRVLVRFQQFIPGKKEKIAKS